MVGEGWPRSVMGGEPRSRHRQSTGIFVVALVLETTVFLLSVFFSLSLLHKIISVVFVAVSCELWGKLRG